MQFIESYLNRLHALAQGLHRLLFEHLGEHLHQLPFALAAQIGLVDIGGSLLGRLLVQFQTRLLGIVRGLLFRHFGGGIRAFGLRGDLLGRLANLFGIRGSNVSHIIGIADRLRRSRRVRIFSSHRFSF